MILITARTDRSGCSRTATCPDSDMIYFSFNAKDEIYSSNQLMFNLVNGDTDFRCLKLDCIRSDIF